MQDKLPFNLDGHIKLFIKSSHNISFAILESLKRHNDEVKIQQHRCLQAKHERNLLCASIFPLCPSTAKTSLTSPCHLVPSSRRRLLVMVMIFVLHMSRSPVASPRFLNEYLVMESAFFGFFSFRRMSATRSS